MRDSLMHSDVLLLPGLINTHTHLYRAFARGMALKQDAPANFTEILERLWWRLNKTLTLEDVYWSAMVGMVDCIRNGVTTLFDHHASPCAIAGSLLPHRPCCARHPAAQLPVLRSLRPRWP